MSIPLLTIAKEAVTHPIKTSSLGTKYVLGTETPFYASFDTNNSCNLRCHGCDFPILLEKGAFGKDPAVDTLEDRLNKLHDAFGSMLIVFAGFEPTVRKDLPLIIRAANVHHYAGIVTNGTLVTPELAKAYWEAGLKFASVSIPSFDNARFLQIIGADQHPRLKQLGLERVKESIEILMETAPPTKFVTITATFDNKTTPDDIRNLAVYAQSLGVLLSLQPYSPSKPSSADSGYDVRSDPRAMTPATLDSIFGGSISGRILELQREFPIIVGRESAIRNFDRFIRLGYVEFKPRALKISAEGNVALYPEGPFFANIDASDAPGIRQAFGEFVQTQRASGFFASNCYRCVNLTLTSSFWEMARSALTAFARKPYTTNLSPSVSQ